MPQPVTNSRNEVPSAISARSSGDIVVLIGSRQAYPGSPFQPAADNMEPVVASYASLPMVVPNSGGEPAVSVKWTTKYSAAPSAVSISLQGSNNNSSWTTIDTSTNTAGETRTVTAQAYQFYRALVNSVTGSVNAEVTAQVIAG